MISFPIAYTHYVVGKLPRRPVASFSVAANFVIRLLQRYMTERPIQTVSRVATRERAASRLRNSLLWLSSAQPQTSPKVH